MHSDVSSSPLYSSVIQKKEQYLDTSTVLMFPLSDGSNGHWKSGVNSWKKSVSCMLVVDLIISAYPAMRDCVQSTFFILSGCGRWLSETNPFNLIKWFSTLSKSFIWCPSATPQKESMFLLQIVRGRWGNLVVDVFTGQTEGFVIPNGQNAWSPFLLCRSMVHWSRRMKTLLVYS